MYNRLIKKIYISAFILVFILSYICSAQEESPMGIMQEHKIDFESPGLLDFLENGFPNSVKLNDLPKNPEEKTQLLIYAIQEMGKRHKKEAVPLLIRYANLDFPSGANKIIQRDIETVPINGRMNEQTKLYSYLKYNAINSLGWIRDVKALPVIKENFQRESETIIKIQYALCLGMLGDAESVNYLVEQIGNNEQTESAASALNFYYLTGVNPGISVNTSKAKKIEQVKLVQDWWKQNSNNYKINVIEAGRRRLEPFDDLPKVQEGSLRALLLASSFYLDFSNKYKSFEAREELKKNGDKYIDDYEKIAFDKMEDLRIRQEAIRKYFGVKQKKSKRLLKKLLKDENTQIVELAKDLLNQIKELK